MDIPIEISARHVHLAKADVVALFGSADALICATEISQPGQFAAAQTITLRGSKGSIDNVRVVGPVREATQVELAVTDCYTLGVKPHIAISGDLADTPGGITLVGPHGSVDLSCGVIVAKRHMHIAPEQAAELGIKHLDTVSIRIGGERSVTFHNVVVRSRQDIDDLAVHLDTDEANAAGISPGATGEIIL